MKLEDLDLPLLSDEEKSSDVEEKKPSPLRPIEETGPMVLALFAQKGLLPSTIPSPRYLTLKESQNLSVVSRSIFMSQEEIKSAPPKTVAIIPQTKRIVKKRCPSYKDSQTVENLRASWDLCYICWACWDTRAFERADLEDYSDCRYCCAVPVTPLICLCALGGCVIGMGVDLYLSCQTHLNSSIFSSESARERNLKKDFKLIRQHGYTSSWDEYLALANSSDFHITTQPYRLSLEPVVQQMA